jgi:hypothetical protein
VQVVLVLGVVVLMLYVATQLFGWDVSLDRNRQPVGQWSTGSGVWQQQHHHHHHQQQQQAPPQQQPQQQQHGPQHQQQQQQQHGGAQGHPQQPRYGTGPSGQGWQQPWHSASTQGHGPLQDDVIDVWR